jgi:hypothetical protein
MHTRIAVNACMHTHRHTRGNVKMTTRARSQAERSTDAHDQTHCDNGQILRLIVCGEQDGVEALLYVRHCHTSPPLSLSLSARSKYTHRTDSCDGKYADCRKNTLRCKQRDRNSACTCRDGVQPLCGRVIFCCVSSTFSEEKKHPHGHTRYYRAPSLSLTLCVTVSGARIQWQRRSDDRCVS